MVEVSIAFMNLHSIAVINLHELHALIHAGHSSFTQLESYRKLKITEFIWSQFSYFIFFNTTRWQPTWILRRIRTERWQANHHQPKAHQRSSWNTFYHASGCYKPTRQLQASLEIPLSFLHLYLSLVHQDTLREGKLSKPLWTPYDPDTSNWELKLLITHLTVGHSNKLYQYLMIPKWIQYVFTTSFKHS